MVHIQAETKRALLRSLARAAKKAGRTIRDAIDAYQDDMAGAVKSGRLILHTSRAGQSTSLEMSSQWRQLTQEQVTAYTEELVNVHEDSVVVLASNGNAAPDDNQILAAMLLDDRLQGVSSAGVDFTSLGVPYR